jgi:hypothetical protein
MPAKKSKNGPQNSNGPPSYPLPERELIVVAEAEAKLKAGIQRIESRVGADIAALNTRLSEERISLELLFGPSEERLAAEASELSAAAGAGVPDLSVYYRVRAEDERLDDLARSLAALPGISQAYVKPPAEPPVGPPSTEAILEEETAAEVKETPPATPDFTARQGYLVPAPEGVDAVYAATQVGGRGAGIDIIDIEGAWNFAHEDLVQNQGGVVGGTPTTDLAWRNHGTAVAGEFGGDLNGFGVTGISPEAHVRAISIFGGLGSSAAIHQAANILSPGDIILIELHRAGPRHNFQPRDDQKGYIALEWWPDDFDAIRYATSKGVIVVEAAGNGAENLDDGLYDTPPSGFPATWKNPFNPANPSSLAVLVGAGAPPPGTHGRTYGPDRSRLDFSNYGARVDAQGWGREVTTTGGSRYSPGDLQGGAENVWYADTFSGTSSASPIVVGSIACIQGILSAAGQSLLTPAQAIQILRDTGSPQQDAPGRPASQRIGNRPDIKAAMAQLMATAVESGIATQYWDEELAYPLGTAASLWLHVNGAWRKRDNATPHHRSMVQRAFATAGTEVRVWYQAAEIVGLVVNSR